MTKGFVANLRADWDGVLKVVNVVFGGAEFILLAEDADAIQPPHFCRTTALAERYPRGRAFDANREVRWRTAADNRFTIIYLSETARPPEEARFTNGDPNWETHRTCQKLYGKWSATMRDWIEVGVPGVRGRYKQLVAESPPPNALRLEVVDYLRGGLVQMTRFCAIDAYK